MRLLRPLTSVPAAILFMALFASINFAGDKNQEAKEEGEEPGTRFTLNEKCDTVRKGIRLVLAYDDADSAFVGTVENVTRRTIKSMRVEVHLSNSIELGPTKSVNLGPGKNKSVKLFAKNQSFTWWTAHAEAGEGEHHGEYDGEHDGEHERGREHQ